MINKYGSAVKQRVEASKEQEDDGHSKGSKSTAISADTGKVLTTPYPHKWKTTMCRFWKQNKLCPFGEAACNYAHGSEQLRVKTSKTSKKDSAANDDQKKDSMEQKTKELHLNSPDKS